MTLLLLSIGHGYSAQRLAALLLPQGWNAAGTSRSPDRAAALSNQGVTPLLWPGDDIGPVLDRASHLLISVAPGPDGDPVLAALRPVITARANRFAWVGYLSTTGVYGDQGGGWVDEDTPLNPTTARGRARVAAEAAWAEIPAFHCTSSGWQEYMDPDAAPFAKLRAGTARRIVKPGQVFSRTHVDDIAQTLAASIAAPAPGAVYNVCDDDPAPPEAVIDHAARLLGLPPPPVEDFASAEMTPMARSFYAESKRVRNDKIKSDLGVRLIHPDFRSGLAALLAAETTA